VKPFLIWLGFIAVVFGVFTVVAVALHETSQVFVVVDASNRMSAEENRIVRELGRIDERDDAEFALATVSDTRNGTGLVHRWQSSLRWEGAALFGPCSFTAIDSFAETSEADERILITTSNSCDTAALIGWEIILLD